MHPSRTLVGRTSRLVALFALAGSLPAAAQTHLLRFPDIHGQQVAFTYAGDLWTAPAQGGTAYGLQMHVWQWFQRTYTFNFC